MNDDEVNCIYSNLKEAVLEAEDIAEQGRSQEFFQSWAAKQI
jgi:hypothetical protein